MTKFASLLAACVCLLSLVVNASAGALSVVVQPTPATPVSTTPDVVVTTLGGSSLLDFAEIYNQSSVPVNLAGWELVFSVHSASGCSDQTFQVMVPSGWLLPKAYFTFERGATVPDDNAEAYFSVPSDWLAGCVTPQLAGVALVDASGNNDQATTFAPGTLAVSNWAAHKQRGKSSLTITGTFASDYNIQTTGSLTLNSVPLYNLPGGTGGLQIVELLPNSISCPPGDTSLTCNDYVKLFNISAAPANLSAYRLRTSYGGLSSTTSNTISLNGTLAPGAYTLVNTKNSGASLDLTQTGGYVWLEDAHGAQIYQPVIQYPDASSTTKNGWAWAFDGAVWRWTSSPQPLGANYFPPDESAASPTTSTGSSLKLCQPGQERNPDTNRCRSILVAAGTQQACQPGQERNPATNRCRSTAAASTGPKPCPAGQTRNTTTNRCRKTAANLANVRDVKATASPSGSGLRWIIAAAAGLGALAYAVYEWRQDISTGLDRLRNKLAPSSLVKLRRPPVPLSK